MDLCTACLFSIHPTGLYSLSTCFYYTNIYLYRTLFRVIMPCEPCYTARCLAFTLSILLVFPFNFSRYLPRFRTLIEFLAANPFLSYSSLFHIFAVLSFQALADRGRGGVPLVAPFAQIILVRQIVTSLHHFVVTSSSRSSNVRPIYASSIFPLHPSRLPKPPLPHEPLAVSSCSLRHHDVLAQQAAEADRLSSALTATFPALT